MASVTKAYMNKHMRRLKNAGRKRKNQMARHSTPSWSEFFGDPSTPRTAETQAPHTTPTVAAETSA